MSKEYIDRVAIRDLLYKEDAITMKGVAMINTFPAADVEERANGAWVEKYAVTIDNEVIEFGYYSCSKCEFKSGWIYNFCPRCGADMRGTP